MKWQLYFQDNKKSKCPPQEFFYAECKCFIAKTCLYNTDPLKPHFYIVKLGFTGVYIIFLISAQNIDCEYPQSMFWAEIRKISEFLSENFQFLEVKFSLYLNRHVFVMYTFVFTSIMLFYWLLQIRLVLSLWIYGKWTIWMKFCLKYCLYFQKPLQIFCQVM